MHKVLQSYLKKLTNLTGNNRSLLLLRLFAEQYIDLHSFDHIDGRSSFSIIEDLIAGKKKIPLSKLIDSHDEDSNIVSRRLKKIQRVERMIYQERGARDLYVGWPFVKGKLSDGTPIRCPLLFFPVQLEINDNKWVLEIRQDVNLTLNKSFLLAFSYYNGVKIEDSLLERVFDDFDKNSRSFRTDLYELIKESPIEINFNQENFIDNLSYFKDIKKADFDDEEKNGLLKLYPEAVLGIFPQADSYLVPDYVKMIEGNSFQDTEEFFLQRTIDQPNAGPTVTRGFNYSSSIKEEQTFTPFKMDAYQENAIKAVKRGNSLVVQGPPGTGKSQLISNLVADFMARGKRVLVVCQKRAALDVVYDRLKSIGVDEFTALVHDFKNDRKLIYEQISGQIRSIEEYQFRNNSLDFVQLERQFLQSSRRIDQITEELEEFKFALYDESEAGISVKELYLTSGIEEASINMKQEYKLFRFSTLDDFARKLREYVTYSNRFDKDDYLWKERQPFLNYGIADLKNIIEIVNEIPQYQNELKEETNKIIHISIDFDSCETILEAKEEIGVMLDSLRGGSVYDYFQHISQYRDNETDLLWLSNLERVLLESFKGYGPETSLKAEELGRFQEVLQSAMETRKNAFKWIRWKLFSKDKTFITRVLVSNGLQDNRKGFDTLVEKVDSRLNLEHNLTQLKSSKWLIDIPTTYDKIDFQSWFFHQKKALKSKLIFSKQRNFKEYFNVNKIDYDALKNQLVSLLTLFQEIPIRKNNWMQYLTQSKIQYMLNKPEMKESFLGALNSDFDSLCEFDTLKQTIESHQISIIEKLIESLDETTEDNAENLFQNSLRLSWIDHIETKYPILRSVSSLKFQGLVKELQSCVKNKLMISNEILLLKIREQTYQDVEYNRLKNMVTYRDLEHQVNKKRRIWPLRRVLMEHSEEVFRLIPCWLASPDSVSAIFQMEQLFDLVIFDEASQCFAERGIPAMYRGKQVVISGDDKQLSPNELYKVRWEEEDEAIADLEIDSLLNLGSKYLMQMQLMGHYRSKSLDLIDFSNQHFYNGSLKMLPDFDYANLQEPAIKYVKVDGVWENNINDAEATKVVELILEILKIHPKREIGVVTFNARQQGHILDKLDELIENNGVELSERFFVKNIENVQGDEVDTLIFSTAYAPDQNGRMIMQFGSLNAVGGENRMNVAITRARENVIVVTSIYPNQLKVEESKNEGPKILKEYLQYALNVSEGNYKPTIRSQKGNHHEWYLKNKLKKMPINGHFKMTLEEELPFADLTLKEGDAYRALVLTDDDLYYQSLGIKDAHVYTPFTLNKKKWKSKGFFSREYWHNKQQIEDSLLRLLSDSKE